MSRLRVGSSENQGSYYVKDGNFSLISRPWGPTSYPVVTATSSSQDKHKANFYQPTGCHILEDGIFYRRYGEILMSLKQNSLFQHHTHFLILGCLY